jgi:hypothetical protein
LISALGFVVPFLLFVSFPSRFWNFDGVACAAALELGNPVFLFHSNHLLYGFLGYLFWQVVRPFGLVRALPALQLFTSLLAAGGFAGVYTLAFSRVGKTAALLLTLCAATSAVGWMWSIEAQVYALGFLALAWATRRLLQPDSPRKWLAVGGLHAAAVLGHVVHFLWLVPALYWLVHHHTRPGRRLAQYLGALAAGTVIPYLIVFLGVILPGHSADHWPLRWLMGSAGLNRNSLFSWHFAGWSGPLIWAKATLRVFWGSFWPYQTDVPGWAWALTGCSALALAGLLAVSFRRRDAIWRLAAIWLVTYGLFFWSWEPQTECYRLTDWIPLVLLLSVAIQQLHGVTAYALLLVIVLGFAAVNLRTRILPMQDAQRNAAFQEITALAAKTAPNTLYLTVGGMPRLYLLYFAGRAAWDLNNFAGDPARLGAEITRRAATAPAVIRQDAVSTPAAQPWVTRYHLKALSPDLPWLQLQ